jgi:type I restriction enzyme, S subunit
MSPQELGECVNQCPEIALEELCEGHIPTRDPRRDPDAEFSYVDISSVDNVLKRIDDPKRLLGAEAPSRARQSIRTGDVLVSTTRPNLNAVALVSADLDGQLASTGFCVLRPRPLLDSEYLFAFVCSNRFVGSVTDLVKGAMYPAVTDSQVRAQRIPLPPLLEQQRISARVRVQLSEVARASTAVHLQLDAARALRVAMVNTIFESHEMRSWGEIPLAEICMDKGTYGTSSKSSTEALGIAVIRMGNISDGTIKWDDLKYMHLPESELVKYELLPGDILFNRTNSAELVGKSAVYDGSQPAVFASYLIRFRLLADRADPSFVCTYINSARGRAFIEANMTRAIGQVNISASTMRRMPIALPPLPQQRAIVKKLDRELADHENLREALKVRIEAIGRLRSSILSKVFRDPTR